MTTYINDDYKIGDVMKAWYTGTFGRISPDLEAEVANVRSECFSPTAAIHS